MICDNEIFSTESHRWQIDAMRCDANPSCTASRPTSFKYKAKIKPAAAE